MMKFIIILLYVNYFFQINSKSGNQEIIVKEIIHGILQNDSWKIGMSYEYYIDISNYDLDEENMFEIYGTDYYIDSYHINLYILYTNISDVELIKNKTIKPDLIDDKYEIISNNIQFDSLTDNSYFFFPFKKKDSSHNY